MTDVMHALGVCYVTPELFEETEGQQNPYSTPDSSHAQVFVFFRQVFLSVSQALILKTLMQREGTYVSRNKLLDALGVSGKVQDRNIDTLVKRLRQNLFPKNRQAGKVFIQTKYLRGYRIPTREQLKKLEGP